MSELHTCAESCLETPPKDSIVEAICTKFQQRSAVGWKKYGTTLDREDLSINDWIQHAQEELMDGILYLEKLKKEISAMETAVIAAASIATTVATTITPSTSGSSPS